MQYVRIDNPQYTHLFETADIGEALDRAAQAGGAASFEASAETAGKTVDEARGELDIAVVGAADVVADIAAEALDSDALAGGAETPFASARDWADWCIEGSDGDAVRALAHLHDLDVDPLVGALREALSERDLDDINKPFLDRAKEAVREAESLDELRSALMGVHELIGDDGMRAWFGRSFSDGEVPHWGPEPRELDYVWSWDDERVLVDAEDGPFDLDFRDR
ncbi:hypothetical protein SAMN04487843_105115 [Methylobacterium sp. ap11]|uniref:hypothetical protein n=1 Tax=Methylobacterium sp. ap11 TaxID=1761799 RepID=UPI0008CB3EFD|nr:hypothetical protein [Methylobacterium sp. ap11]SEO94155.1 hypothetical protein SAMN04487843_105115 [Methylobacterium sp. ap11]